MKANAALRSDEAVSPVISVIMMVAITVVLAAGVYVWVSSQDAHAAGAPGSFAITSAGNAANPGPGNYYKNYTMVAAMPGFTYGQLALTLDGAPLQAELGAGCEPSAAGSWSACNGGAPRDAAASLGAGDVLTLRLAAAPGGATLRFLDPASNSVVYTVAVG
jgi:flagellin-like protein